ncbi:hypothetical protein MRS76_20250 [Rhizobiaceae bacterium n13]|uniref:hypothetical protein n=1 Tax=Ferirhizobium litorale TaxID=2927786 RepID=UPI0024B2AD4A|nr:hypothetical protein [Fererhizobium litorale]MDI7864274.1 hypothetical protein [Fererhizobium litorale]
MPIFEDKGLTQGSTADEKKDFQIAWLHRRVENLEAIVLELLDGRVDPEDIDAYRTAIKGESWNPHSVNLEDAAKLLVAQIKQTNP